MKMWLKICLIITLVSIFFGPSFFGYIKNSQNLYIYNDDAVQYIPPFFHYQKNNNIVPDYADKYYLDVIYPAGYKKLFIIFSKYFSPIVLSKVLPYITLFILLVSVGVITWKFGGAVGSFSVVCLVLSGEIFLAKMGGGLPRAFGFPILAMALAAGLYGRIYLLAVTVVIGTMFYPVTAVISGVFLAGLLLFPNKYTGIADVFNFKKRFVILFLVVLLSAVFIIPQMMRGGVYGDKISLHNIVDYPEAELGGRYSHSESLTHTFFLYNLVGVADGLLGNNRSDMALSLTLVVIVLIAVLAVYCFIKAWKEKKYEVVRYSIFFGSALACYLISIIFLPYFYFPERYLTYALPLFCVTIIPLLVFNNKIWMDKPKLKPVFLIIITGLIVFWFGGGVNSSAGLTVNAEKYQLMYNYINTLPEDAVVAGWPGKIYMDGLNYITKRDVFLTYEIHQVLHVGYIGEMKNRIYSLVDAYLATDIKTLDDFNKQTGVDYLIMDMDDFDNVPPDYFKPFDKYIEEKWKKAQENNLSFVLPSLQDRAVFTKNNLFILDLRSIQ